MENLLSFDINDFTDTEYWILKNCNYFLNPLNSAI